MLCKSSWVVKVFGPCFEWRYILGPRMSLGRCDMLIFSIFPRISSCRSELFVHTESAIADPRFRNVFARGLIRTAGDSWCYPVA